MQNLKKIKFTIFVLLLSLQIMVAHSENRDTTQTISLYSFDLMPVLNPWLNSTNPSGLSLTPNIFPGKMSLGYRSENGDYKRIQQGEEINHYNFQTLRYTKIKNTNLFGSFSYDKSYENGTYYSNLNNPYRETPYLLIDTIGNDIIDREFFTLNGVLSTPVNQNLTWGISTNFNVGLASQNRDPRPKNKVLDFSLSSGLKRSFSNLNIGLNLIYSYYNEDIEIDIVKENTNMAFFQLHGLGTSTYHVASSFNRLYKQNSFGGEFQLNFRTGNLNSLFGAKLLHIIESADDGRKAGNASWSYIKNDSELEGTKLYIYNSTIINNNSSIHCFNTDLKISNLLGSEIIQRLEVIGDADSEDWITYSKEEKYSSLLIEAGLSYNYLKMRNKYNRNYDFKFAINYLDFEQAYYIPNQKENYKNLLFSLNLDKSFQLKRNVFSIGAGLKYKYNINGSQEFEENTFIIDKLLLPDFNYLTSNYFAQSLNLSYEIPLKKYFDQYFFNINIDTYQGNRGLSRTIINFNTGVIF